MNFSHTNGKGVGTSEPCTKGQPSGEGDLRDDSTEVGTQRGVLLFDGSGGLGLGGQLQPVPKAGHAVPLNEAWHHANGWTPRLDANAEATAPMPPKLSGEADADHLVRALDMMFA